MTSPGPLGVPTPHGHREHPRGCDLSHQRAIGAGPSGAGSHWWSLRIPKVPGLWCFSKPKMFGKKDVVNAILMLEKYAWVIYSIYICIIIIKPYIWKKQLFYFWLLKQPNILACRSRMGRSEGETNCKRGLQWGARHSYPIYPPAFNRKKWIEKSEKPPLSLPIVPQSLQGGAPAHELSWCKYPQQLWFLVFSGIYLDI